MSKVIGFAKLPIQIPQWTSAQLLADQQWQPHYNETHYSGQWSVLPLRSAGGRIDRLSAELTGEAEYSNTPLMVNFNDIDAFIKTLKCPLMAVRLLNLHAGSVIKQHRDFELAFEKGEARLHIPIVTNNAVEFFVNNEQVRMRTNECWYINANLPHRVANKGETNRIHLVIDCQVNDWLADVFERSERRFFKQGKDEQQTLKVISELRLQQTDTANSLADQLELALFKNTDE
jgi:mannose-6-phosphate isomerase-like protein (cupin superfamily)